jgi:hypothetical protein
VPTGLTVTNSPVTTTGTIAISLSSGYVIPTQSFLDGLVPYTGATANVDLGNKTLTSQNLIVTHTSTDGGVLNLKIGSSRTIQGAGFVSLYADTGVLGFIDSIAGNIRSAKFSLGSITNNQTRTYTLPDADGTIALTSDLTGGTVTSVAELTIGTTGTDITSTVANGTTTPVITLNIPTASATNRGALSSTDWSTFSNKQNALTNPVTGTGTTNTLPKFTGSTTIGNSQIFDNGTSVGIGTATPASNYILTLRTQDADYTKVLDWGTAVGGSWGNMTINTADAPYQTILNSGAWQFNTGGSLKMFLDASGNLGLGVTPSASWANTFKVLQIGTVSSLWNFSSVTGLSNNIYDDGTGSKYLSNGFASIFEQSAGQFKWLTAPSGTAGNAITFTQAMTLNASGNLSIGNVNDTFKLDVSGTSYFYNSGGSLDSATIVGNSGANALTIRLRVNNDYAFLNWRSFDGTELLAETYIQRTATNTATLRHTINNGGTPATYLTIASTGAATFSSSVTASNFYSPSGTGFWSDSFDVRRNGFFADGTNLIFRAGTSSTGEQTRLTISQSTGAATFSSSVMATQFVANGASTVPNLILNGPSTTWTRYQTSGTDRWDVGNNVGGLSSNQFSFYSNGANSNVLVIQQNGNVGIGNVASNARLYISANAGVDVLNVAGYDVLKWDTGDILTFGGYKSGQWNAVAFATTGAERMRITSGGAVEMTGSVKTGAPSGGTAKPIKFGAVQAASSLTGDALQVEVDGVVYLLGIVSPP